VLIRKLGRTAATAHKVASIFNGIAWALFTWRSRGKIGRMLEHGPLAYDSQCWSRPLFSHPANIIRLIIQVDLSIPRASWARNGRGS
jgi:hypothetical protein